MLVNLSDLEPFHNTHEFLVDLQSGELFVMLQGRWHPTGLMCRKRSFEVEQLMALIQHASIKLKNRLFRRKGEETEVLTLDLAKAQPPPLPFIPEIINYTTQDKLMSPAMRKNYIKDRAQATVMYITEYGNTTLWNLENLVPSHKLIQCLQIIFGRMDTVREAIDRSFEHDDAIRRKKCMCYLKLPKRFPVPEDMCNEETATWINWIHLEMQALLKDLNEEIRLQNEEDDPFMKGIVYAPTGAIEEPKNITISQESSIKNRFGGKISPQTQEQHEDKLAFPLPVDKTSNPLPQCTTDRYTRWQAEEMSEILPVNMENRELRTKPPVYIAKTSNTR